MSNNKIRLILIYNATTSLFMRSYYGQLTDDNMRNIGLCVLGKRKIFLSKEERSRDKDIDHISREIWGDLGMEFCLLDFDQPKVDQNDFSLGGIIKNRRLREENFKYLMRILQEKGISFEDVAEIWGHEHWPVINELLFLCREAKFTLFEHGLGDVMKMIHQEEVRGGVVFFLKKVLKRKIKSLESVLIKSFFYFDQNSKKVYAHASLLSEEMAQINQNPKYVRINPCSLLEVGVQYIGPQCKELVSRLESPTAVVLLSSIKPFARSAQDDDDFLNSLERYLWDNRAALFDVFGVKSILFKNSIPFEEVSGRDLERMRLLSQKYKLFSLSDYVANYPFEYYLNVIKPSVVCSVECSSALFYAKKACPSTHFFSMIDWFNDYCLSRFQKIHWDTIRLIDFWDNEKYYLTFCGLLPQRIEIDAKLDYDNLRGKKPLPQGCWLLLDLKKHDFSSSFRWIMSSKTGDKCRDIKND